MAQITRTAQRAAARNYSRRPGDRSDMGCQEFGEAVSAWLDGEISATEAASVEAHLAACARCRADLSRAAQLNRLLALQVARPAPDVATVVLDQPATNVHCLPDRPRLYVVGVATCGCPASCSCGCQRNQPCRCAVHVA